MGRGPWDEGWGGKLMLYQKDCGLRWQRGDGTERTGGKKTTDGVAVRKVIGRGDSNAGWAHIRNRNMFKKTWPKQHPQWTNAYDVLELGLIIFSNSKTIMSDFSANRRRFLTWACSVELVVSKAISFYPWIWQKKDYFNRVSNENPSWTHLSSIPFVDKQQRFKNTLREDFLRLCTN